MGELPWMAAELRSSPDLPAAWPQPYPGGCLSAPHEHPPHPATFLPKPQDFKREHTQHFWLLADRQGAQVHIVIAILKRHCGLTTSPSVTTACQHNWGPKWGQVCALNLLPQEKGVDKEPQLADLSWVNLLLPGITSPCTQAHKQPPAPLSTEGPERVCSSS